MRLLVKAPTRIDLCGGTLDLWPIHQVLHHRVCTINVGISLFAEVEIETLGKSTPFQLSSKDFDTAVSGSFDEVVFSKDLPLLSLILKQFWKKEFESLKIKTVAGSPPGAGLGGSSALAIAIAFALNHLANKLYNVALLSNDELVRVCRDLEARIIHTPTGVQDYWGAVNGGLNIIEFPPGKTVVSSFHDGIENLGLEKQMIVFYSGQSRASAINNWEIFKRVFDRDPKTIAGLENLAACADRAASSLSRGDRKSFFQASKDEWKERVMLWPGVETEQTKALSEIALDHGAEFVRVCGAGGGGVMVAFCGDADRQILSKALETKGARILDVSLVKKGVHITEEST